MKKLGYMEEMDLIKQLFDMEQEFPLLNEIQKDLHFGGRGWDGNQEYLDTIIKYCELQKVLSKHNEATMKEKEYKKRLKKSRNN